MGPGEATLDDGNCRHFQTIKDVLEQARSVYQHHTKRTDTDIGLIFVRQKRRDDWHVYATKLMIVTRSARNNRPPPSQTAPIVEHIQELMPKVIAQLIQQLHQYAQSPNMIRRRLLGVVGGMAWVLFVWMVLMMKAMAVDPITTIAGQFPGLDTTMTPFFFLSTWVVRLAAIFAWSFFLLEMVLIVFALNSTVRTWLVRVLVIDISLVTLFYAMQFLPSGACADLGIAVSVTTPNEISGYSMCTIAAHGVVGVGLVLFQIARSVGFAIAASIGWQVLAVMMFIIALVLRPHTRELLEELIREMVEGIGGFLRWLVLDLTSAFRDGLKGTGVQTHWRTGTGEVYDQEGRRVE